MQTSRVVDEAARAADWYTCVRYARPFSELRRVPPELRLPRWFPLLLFAVAAAGLVQGLMSPTQRMAAVIAGSVFHACLYVYITVSILDAIEHFKLEKHVTGRYLGWTVVPLGESLIHLAIVATLVLVTRLARPLEPGLELRDWFVLGAPLLFLGLGWWDELYHHRRRALHREDILHTVSHLAAGTMLVALFVARVLDWHHFQ